MADLFERNLSSERKTIHKCGYQTLRGSGIGLARKLLLWKQTQNALGNVTGVNILTKQYKNRKFKDKRNQKGTNNFLLHTLQRYRCCCLGSIAVQIVLPKTTFTAAYQCSAKQQRNAYPHVTLSPAILADVCVYLCVYACYLWTAIFLHIFVSFVLHTHTCNWFSYMQY